MQEFDRLLDRLANAVDRVEYEFVIAELRQEVIDMKLAAYKRGYLDGQEEYDDGGSWGTA